jgi:hypothetical protein
MNLPGIMSPELLMHPEVQKLLNQYGVSPEDATSAAQGANPNLFINNQQAFEKHPLMAGLIEHGLEGLAFTKPGATIGENLSNIALSLPAAQAARAEKFNNMLTMPFAEAQTVANLKGTAIDQNYKMAQAARDQALVKHYADMDDWHQTANDIRQGQVNMQSEFHKYASDQAVMKELDKFPLDDKGNAALKDLVDSHGGHVSDVPQDSIAQLVSEAHQRQQDALEAGKKTRAQIGATRTTNSTSSNNKIDPAETALYETAFKSADSELSNYDKELANGTATNDNGSLVVKGTPEAVAQRQKYQAARDAAWQKWQDGLRLSQPGSGMTITKKSKTTSSTKAIKTFDPSTGNIR